MSIVLPVVVGLSVALATEHDFFVLISYCPLPKTWAWRYYWVPPFSSAYTVLRVTKLSRCERRLLYARFVYSESFTGLYEYSRSVPSVGHHRPKGFVTISSYASLQIITCTGHGIPDMNTGRVGRIPWRGETSARWNRQRYDVAHVALVVRLPTRAWVVNYAQRSCRVDDTCQDGIAKVAFGLTLKNQLWQHLFWTKVSENSSFRWASSVTYFLLLWRLPSDNGQHELQRWSITNIPRKNKTRRGTQSKNETYHTFKVT